MLKFVCLFEAGSLLVGCRGGHCVDQAGLQLKKILLLQPSVGTKVCATTHGVPVFCCRG